MSIGATVLVSILALAFPERFFAVTTAARDAIASGAGWHYLLLVLLIVAVCVGFAISPIGIIRLGDPTDKPRVSTVSWIAMLFSAGMGIGLVFWGAAEPLAHFASAAPEAPTGSYQALRDAFRYTFFHWGFSAWAIYAIVALALAYFQFRKKEKALLSVTLKPLFGERMDGLAGRLVDALTAFATVVGVGVSLGMGAAQINGGLNYLLGVPQNIFVELAIIVVATVLFLASAMSGLSKGVRLLSNVNVILAIDAGGSVRGSWSHHADPQRPHRRARVVPAELRQHEHERRSLRRRAPGMGAGLDHLLLGVVDRLVALRRRVHRPHLPRTHHPGVPAGRGAGAHGLCVHMVRDVRHHVHRRAAWAA